MSYLYYLLLAFKIWMLTDLYRRQAEGFWYFVIFFVPGGEFIYFFVVKSRDLSGVRTSLAREFDLARGASVKRLRADVEQIPSVANMLALATALYDRREYSEAKDWYQRIVDGYAEEITALYGLGLCLLELGQPAEAIPVLSRATALEPAFLGHAAMRALVLALWRSGRSDEALEQAKALMARDGRTDHRALYGEILLDLGRREEALKILREAIAHYDGSPAYVRRMNRAAYAKVKRLIASAR